MTLWKQSAREISSRPGRAALTLLSVVIGVAAVVSVAAATRATRRAFDEMYVTLAGRSALEVVAAGGGSFSTETIPALEKVPGITAAVPLIQRPTIVSRKGKRIKLLTLGVDPERDKLVRDYEVKEGEFLEDGGMLEAAFARAVNLSVGDSVNLVTRQGLQKVRIGGLLEARGAAAFSHSGVLFVALELAQELFDEADHCDTVNLVLADGADEASVMTAVQGMLPAGLTVRTPSSRTQLAKEALVSMDQGLHTASAYSLVAALFIIMNTFLMNVGERRRQLGILRAIGATRRQVVQMILGEAIALGLIGTLIGIPVGLGGAYLLTRVMEQMYGTAMPTLDISPWPLLAGAGFGVGISLLAAWIPARHAGRASPLDGMRPISAEDAGKMPVKLTIAAVLIFVLSTTALLSTVGGWIPPGAAIPIGMLSLVGFVMLIPAALGLLTWLVSQVLMPLLRVEGRLARTQLLRRRVRTALTVGVLVVAVATGLGMGNTIMDNVDDVQQWYHRTVVGDFFVRATMPDVASGTSAEMPAELAGELQAIDGIVGLDTIRFVNTEAAGRTVAVVIREYSKQDKLSLDLLDGSPTEIRAKLAAGEVVLGSVLAHREGLKPGDEITVQTRAGDVPLRVAGTATDYTGGGLVIFMERAVAERLLEIEGVDAYIVKAAPESVDAVEKAVAALCDKYGLLLQSFADISRIIDGVMWGVVGSLWAILALVLIVAAFGIVNTLTMNVLEQTREIGILRVVAMTRWQVRKTILSQAAMIGSMGVLVGSVAGIVVAYIINLCTLPVLGHQPEFAFRPLLVLAYIPIALVIVLIAALVPAERAARLKLVDALHSE